MFYIYLDLNKQLQRAERNAIVWNYNDERLHLLIEYIYFNQLFRSPCKCQSELGAKDQYGIISDLWPMISLGMPAINRGPLHINKICVLLNEMYNVADRINRSINFFSLKLLKKKFDLVNYGSLWDKKNISFHLLQSWQQ